VSRLYTDRVPRDAARLLAVPALALALVAGALAAEAAVVPAKVSAIVLSVRSSKHTLRLVESARVVDVPYRGALPSGLAPGARVRFTLSSLHATALVVAGVTDHVSVPGFVAQRGKGYVLRLADDSTLPLAHIGRLRVGELARVVVRFAKGGKVVGTPVHATTTAPTTPPPTSTKPTATQPTTTAPTTGKCLKADCTVDLIASVLSIDNAGDLTLLPVSGGEQIQLGPGTVDTSTVYAGDFLHVTGTQNATTGEGTLDSLEELVGCDNATCTLTLDATVDEVDDSDIVVEDSYGDEYQIAATAAQLANLDTDAHVHIVGTQDPETGNYTATTITLSK
jgi:hypothetical protein